MSPNQSSRPHLFFLVSLFTLLVIMGCISRFTLIPGRIRMLIVFAFHWTGILDFDDDRGGLPSLATEGYLVALFRVRGQKIHAAIAFAAVKHRHSFGAGNFVG